MHIKIHRGLADAIGEANLREFQIEADTFKWNPVHEIDLRDYTPKELSAFRRMVEKYPDQLGSKTILKDLATWRAAIDDPGLQKARSVKAMVTLMTEYIRTAPGNRLFAKDKDDPDGWLCYYVNEVKLIPEQRSRSGDYSPPYCRVEIVYEEFGGRHKNDLMFAPSECINHTAAQALANDGYYIETNDSRARYLDEKDRWRQYLPLVGMQFMAGGVGTDNLDGNDDDRWDRHRSNVVILERDGQKSRVVVDVYHEGDKKPETNRCEIDPWFWRSDKYRFLKEGTDDDDEDDEDDKPKPKPKKNKSKTKITDSESEMILEDEGVDPNFSIEIPVHPKLACFDLKKHLRLRIHVNNLTPYVYDTELHRKLVLPDDNRGLVEMLLKQKEAFTDIVAGKSGGTIILCAGSPGTGKTLTAEVYAEAMERPLYSVQASQLGISPEDLEKELMLVLGRGKRWDAVMLLDEADVYVHSRGNDLQQNAIVGVFLRVLEYHASVLFLTTNRAELVDDAIASRCTAKIEFAAPTQENQCKIWRILADTAGIQIDDNVIAKVAKDHPKISGRDVKNLLKLAYLMSKTTGKPISAQTIDYVLKFKPTAH